MLKQDLLVLALKKAKSKKGVMANGMQEEERQERLIKILKDELGTESSKIGDGDMVEFNVSGKVVRKNNSDFEVSVTRAYIPKKDEKNIKDYPIPSPSA